MQTSNRKINFLLKDALQNRKILYLINGTIIFGINIFLAYIIVKIPFSSNERIQNNISNAITTELMVFISFFIHDQFTWKNNNEKFTKKIIRYHLVMLISILIRLFSFFIFDYLYFPYLLSTILSIAIIVLFNFFGFEKYVFMLSK